MIGGIGKVTEHILKEVFGINTCEQMLDKSSYLCALFSQSTADFFYSVGLGLGKTDFPQVRFRKSISNERTFSVTEDEVVLHKKLAELAEMLSTDMQKEGLHGRTLTLKLKTASFEVRNRAVTLQNYMNSSEDILKHASKLLKAELPVSVRLIGLRVSQFNGEKFGATPDPTQKTITNFIRWTNKNQFGGR
ncbi:DNA-directed DNA polymerase [Trifolium repens]|nr:DNA/RNA polymerases superfamily protein [Trifolium repens]WJX15401.1 DNA-directed DNA polymerase [Trifolium repens]